MSTPCLRIFFKKSTRKMFIEQNLIFKQKINESNEFKSFRYSEKLYYIYKKKRKSKKVEINDQVSWKSNLKSNFNSLNFPLQFLQNLRTKVEEKLTEIKRTHHFDYETIDTTENRRLQNIEFINNFYLSTPDFTNFFGENNFDYSVIHECQNQFFLIPPKCKFFNKDIRELSNFLNSDVKYDLIVLDPAWKNRYIKRIKKSANKKRWVVGLEF